MKYNLLLSTISLILLELATQENNYYANPPKLSLKYNFIILILSTKIKNLANQLMTKPPLNHLFYA